VIVRSLDAIRAALRTHAPRELPGRRRAAVAVVLHEAAAGPELLFIERAERFGDPWSGQMAFPGGRVDPGDADARAAAERETLEEVGLDLAHAELVGRLGDVNAGVRIVLPLVLSAFVYRHDVRTPLTPNHEVRDALWVPVTRLVDPAQRVSYRFGLGRFPGICVGVPDRQVVWGLTYGLVEELVQVAGTDPRLRRRSV
jgi:8-oxo-dGTP pyrophosphatase MutT (NUDIX family)